MIENWPEKPEGSQWTDDQWKAVVANGRDILVAGRGWVRENSSIS